jgi:hypothetical protein
MPATATIYDSCLADIAKGNIDFDTDSFKVILHTSSFTPNRATMAKRSNLTNEVSSTGYTAGGSAVTVTVASVDTTNHRAVVTFASVVWSTATITARYASIYKSRGGLASADELVGWVDFGQDVTSTGDAWTLPSNILTLQG